MYALRDHLFAVLVGAMAMAVAVVVASAVSAASLPHSEDSAAAEVAPAKQPADNQRPTADPPLSALITATGGACAATLGVMALCQSGTRRRYRPRPSDFLPPA